MLSPLTAHPDYDPALPAKQAAAYLGIHYKTLLGVTRLGEVPVIRSPGGRLSYRLSDLNQYLDARRNRSRSAPGPKHDIDWGA